MKFPRVIAVAVCACFVLAAGCKKNIENQDAIRQGIMNYLSKRSDLLAMDVSVGAVEFRGQDEATATVHFQAKGNPSPAAGMNMQYVLERKGNEWVVKGRTGQNAEHGGNGAPQGGSAPGSLSGMPNLPGQSGGGAGAGSLPPGHPGIGSGSGQALPPGHPAVSPGQVQQK